MPLDLHLPKARGLFITGTDTGVGKTLIAGVIARLLGLQGLRVGVFKPVATGCRHEREGLISEDAEFLAFAADSSISLHVISPICYVTPAAPVVCIEHEHRPMDWEAIAAAYTWLAQNFDVVIVEGIGGAMVPLTQTETVLDLAVEFDLPTVIVARPNLGTINHTLLTVEAVRAAGLPLAGVVISGYDALIADLAEETAPDVIARFADTNVLAVVPRDEASSVNPPRLGPAVLDALKPTDWYRLARS
jgi:dethiobiotin synthetase